VIAAYPQVDKDNHAYLNSLQWVRLAIIDLGQICFPEGFRLTTQKTEDKVYHFIITNQDGIKKYISTLLIQERTAHGVYSPKSLCLISSRPVFSLQQ